MALEFNPPPFVAPRKYPDVVRSLDDVFEAYQRNRQQGRQNRIQELLLADRGIDPRAAGIQGPKGAEEIWGAHVDSYLERKRKATTAGEAQSAAELAKTTAEAAAANAKAAGGGDFFTPEQAAFAVSPDDQKKQAIIAEGFRGHFGERVPKGLVGPMSSGQRAADAAARPNASETIARAYGDKARQANDALERLIGAGFQPEAAVGVLAPITPNIMKSGERQGFEQAERQFVNAVLRRESGAAIPPTELDNYRRQYFPVAGDGSEVIKQKANARALAVKNLENEGAKASSGLPSGKTGPRDFLSPDEVRGAVRAGQLGQKEAIEILRSRFGYE